MKVKVVLKRFARAFVSGAVASALWVSATDVTTWAELGTALNALAISATIGGVAGIIMAGDKLFRWEE